MIFKFLVAVSLDFCSKCFVSQGLFDFKAGILEHPYPLSSDKT